METLLYLRLFNDKTVDIDAEIVGRQAATHELFNGVEQYNIITIIIIIMIVRARLYLLLIVGKLLTVCRWIFKYFMYMARSRVRIRKRKRIFISSPDRQFNNIIRDAVVKHSNYKMYLSKIH